VAYEEPFYISEVPTAASVLPPNDIAAETDPHPLNPDLAVFNDEVVA